MFSPKLIKKQLENASPARADKSINTPKRKCKNGKAATPSVITRSAVKAYTTTSAAAAAALHDDTETDINKNKVTRPAHTYTANWKKETKKQKRRRRNNAKDKKDIADTPNPAHPIPGVLCGESGRASESEGVNTSTRDPLDSSRGTPAGEGTDSEHSVSGRKKKKHKNLRPKKGNRHREETEDREDNFGAWDPSMEESTDSERSMNGSQKKNKKNSHSKKRNRYMDEIEDINQSLLGECLATTITKSGSVVAALAPNTTLYLQGCVVVCPLLGSAEVLGYLLPQGQSQPLYSLPSCSLLGVTAVEGKQVDATLAALLRFPSSWVQDVAQKKKQVTLVEVRPHSSPRVDFLMSAGWGALWRSWDWQKTWSSIGAFVVDRRNCSRHRLTHIPEEWREAAQTVVMSHQCGAVPRVVVGGGKGVGKSTFFKYLVNSLLSAGPDTGVLCLDLDPGQPELSLPTALSLTHLTKPLLGPAYTHHLPSLSPHRTHLLVGAVTPQFVLEEYVAAVRELCREAGVVGGGGLPLVVNTMGWTQGTGLGLMLDVIRLVQPTHLVQLQDDRPARNYPFPLEGAAVAAAKGGIATQGQGQEMHYSLALLPRGGPGSSGPHMAQPKVLRELRVLAEAGQAMGEGCRVSLPWAGVALHVCGEQVPRDRILQALNAQLVALCRVEAGSLHSLARDLPSLLAPNAGLGRLLGWGVVVGMDPFTSHLHLATLMSPEEVKQQVNAIIMPNIHLPTAFYKLFALGNGPYLGEGSREGAGRLRVGRKVKPRGPKR